MDVKFVSETVPMIEDAPEIVTGDQLIVYCARVSNPSNQRNVLTTDRLIDRCIRKKHWSVFSMADMTVRIETSRAVAAQILRHSSFDFQEFSQRYSKAESWEPIELRQQGATDRQATSEPHHNQDYWSEKVQKHLSATFEIYEQMLEDGVARESARMILPMATTTTLFMKGNVRSWIFYMNVRLEESTQKEHRMVAQKVLEIFRVRFPITYHALITHGWL